MSVSQLGVGGRGRRVYWMLAFLTVGAVVSLPGRVGLARVPEAEDSRVAATSFGNMIGRIRAAAASGDWQRAGWNDPAISAGLSLVVDEAKRATGDATVALPVTLADVRPGGAAGARVENTLVVAGGNVSVGFATRSIILADGNVKVSFANDCVIVARGAVSISHGSGNVVVAGHYVNVSHDGSPRPGAQVKQPSVLLSGGVVDVSHANRTVCSAPQLVRISHADGVRFVNAPTVETSHERGQNCPRINGAELTSAPAAKANPLAGKVKVSQVVRGSDSGKGGMVVLEKGGVEWVVRPGVSVTDTTGKAFPELTGWTVSFVGDGFVLFSSIDQQDAAFLVPGK